MFSSQIVSQVIMFDSCLENFNSPTDLIILLKFEIITLNCGEQGEAEKLAFKLLFFLYTYTFLKYLYVFDLESKCFTTEQA